jgi:hypothetical protein
MLIIFGECGWNAREAARVFSDRFPDRPSPDHKKFLRVLARAQETGKVLSNRNEIGGGTRTARTLANEEAILNIVEEDGTIRSIREITEELDISRTSFPLYACPISFSDNCRAASRRQRAAFSWCFQNSVCLDM